MFSLIIFHESAMDGHSKRELLEISNMNEENGTARFFFCWTRHQFLNYLRFFAKLSLDL